MTFQDAIAARIENDIARQTVLATEAQALIEQARDQLSALNRDYEEQQKIAQRYETETRRNTVEMQRKQALVDQLNRKIDAQRQRLVTEGVHLYENVAYVYLGWERGHHAVGCRDLEVAEVHYRHLK